MKNETFLSSFSKRIDLHTEPMASQVLIEIMDDKCVLIERHCGVVAYSKERITVKIPKGCLCIQGLELRLGKMSKDQLKIYGVIHTVKFLERNRGGIAHE